MPRYIIHKDGAYNMYTTIADGACYDKALTLDELRKVISFEHGQSGLSELPERLTRAHKKGCSALDRECDLKSLLVANRAGPNETEMSYDDFVATYLTLPELGKESAP